MNEIEHHNMEEQAAMGECMAQALQAILDDHDAEDVKDLYRNIYKYTACGPWLSVQTHDGVWHHYSDLEGIENGNVRALQVGSIIEGSDDVVEGDIMDLMDYTGDKHPEDAAADFDIQVKLVDEEAGAIFDDLNEDEDE